MRNITGGSMDILFQACGWIGAAGLLVAFYLNSTGKITASDKSYQVANLVSAVLLTLNAFHLGSYPFIIINVFWAGVALLSLVKRR
ncbi:MAG: hypothetical protein OSB25_02465 [Salibacteraceae bacterium]|nr:hypothetical protein [Salibacteraceae bacterium]